MNHLDARARLVFHYAREEADRLGHAVIESEHLLLGLLREGGIAAQVLNSCGLTLEAARHRVIELIGRFERSRDAPPPAITALARRVMDLAGVEAGRYQSSLITTGHVLLGMIHAGDGVAMDIINQVNGGTKAVRRLALKTLNLPPDDESGDKNSGLSGIVAVPADSVLGRLFQAKPEAAIEPEVAAIPPKPELPNINNLLPVQPPEPSEEIKVVLEPKQSNFTAPELEPEIVTIPVPEQVTIPAPEQVTIPAPEQVTASVPEQVTASVPEQVAPPIQTVTSLVSEELGSQELVTSQHPTPVIDAPMIPFVEKTPTLDLDVLPEFVQPQPLAPIPEAAALPELEPVPTTIIPAVPTPFVALEPEKIHAPVLESVDVPVLESVQVPVLESVQELEVMPEDEYPEVLLIDEAFAEVPFEADNEDQDLIPIELDESSEAPTLLPIPQEVSAEPANLEQDIEPMLKATEQVAVQSHDIAELATSLDSKELDISDALPASSLPESEVFSSELEPIISSELEPMLGELKPSPMSETLVIQVDSESAPIHDGNDIPEIASTTVPPTQTDSDLVLELIHDAPQVIAPETDLISSVAEFEAISNVAAEISSEPQPEILLDLTNDLALPSSIALKTASWDMVTAASVIKRQIIALGGGGFSQEPENLLLDNYILEHARSAREVSLPRVCFVSTAAGDSPVYIERFYTAFKTLECEPYHLPLFHPEDWEDELEDMILGADVLYFSGGSTKNALALWKAWELEPVFQQAYEAGTVFAGISAGAICWFEQFTTDSVGRSLGAMEGLGWLPGSFTPHYDAERYRKTMLERLLRSRKISPGFAADDGVAVHFINSEYTGAVSSRPSAKAHHVTLGRNRLVESPLETRYLG